MSTMMISPTSADRFLTKVCAPSRNGLPMEPSSPASPIRSRCSTA
jgi:hypothetical protein